MDIFERVGGELATSMSIWFPGGGAGFYRKLMRRVRMRAKAYGVQRALRYERQHRVLAARQFRMSGVLDRFEVDPELESACFGGLSARTCEICGEAHFTDQHEELTRKRHPGNKGDDGRRGGGSGGGRGGRGGGGRGKGKQHCRNWAATGSCSWKEKTGDDCILEHDPAKKGGG